MIRRSFLLAAAGAGPALLAAGCTGFLPDVQDPPNFYRLTPKSTFGEDLKPVRWQLVVDTPYAAASIDTPRIALMRSSIQVEYYARANWTDRAPLMIQGLIVESFENSGMITSVGRQSVGLRSDYVLVPELREFQAEYFAGTTPDAHVRINVKLVGMPDRYIVAGQSFEAKTPAQSDRMDDIVAAFDEALGRVLKDLVRWTLAEGDRHI